MDLFEAVIRDNINYIRSAIAESRIFLDDNWMDYELLEYAMSHNKNNIAKILIEEGCRIIKPDHEISNTLLHIAVKNENIEMIEILLEKGASIEAMNSFGNTPLHYAAKTKNNGIINIILDKLINDNDQNLTETFKLSPLLVACWRSDLVRVETLLRSGVNPNDLVISTSTFFRNTKVTNDLMDEYSIDWSGYTYLHVAVEHERVQIVKMLLKHGADVNVQNSRGLTPLHLAIQKRNIKIVSFILDTLTEKSGSGGIEGGVDVNIKDYLGNTPLLLAVERNSKGIVELLLKNGADTNLQNAEGASPLSLAVRDKEVDIAGLILSFQCGKCCKFERKYPQSTVSSERQNSSSAIKELVNFTNVSGDTLLHVAVDRGSIALIKLLLNHGADTNKRNAEGLTPLHLATKLRRNDVAEFFLSYSYKSSSDMSCDNIHVAQEDEENGSSFYVDLSETEESEEESRRSDDSSDGEGAPEVPVSQFHEACMKGETDLVEAFIRSGVNVDSAIDANSQRRAGYAGLHLAAEKNCARVAELLVRRGANPNARDKSGLTPLHIAVRRGCLETIRLLLNAGANPDSRNADGNSLLHDLIIQAHRRDVRSRKKAAEDSDEEENRNEGIDRVYNLEQDYYNFEQDEDLRKTEKSADPVEIMNLLLESGCHVDNRNNSGMTAMHIASDACNNTAVQSLLDHGADVNATVDFGITPVLHWCGRKEADEPVCELYRTFRNHLIKLKIIGAEVNNHHLKWFDNEARFSAEDAAFEALCLEERAAMRSIEIDPYSSLYGILFKSPEQMGKYVHDDVLRRIVQSGDLDRICPRFASFVRCQMKRGLDRWRYLKPARQVLKLLTHLPDVCCLEIAHHLPLRDLNVLIGMTKKNAGR